MSHQLLLVHEQATRGGTSPGTNTATMKLVRPSGGGSRRTDEDRAESGIRRSSGSPVREALWTVEAEGERISCELRHHGRRGVEYRVFRDYEFSYGRGFRTRTLAVQAAALVRRQLEDASGRAD